MDRREHGQCVGMLDDERKGAGTVSKHGTKSQLFFYSIKTEEIREQEHRRVRLRIRCGGFLIERWSGLVGVVVRG